MNGRFAHAAGRSAAVACLLFVTLGCVGVSHAASARAIDLMADFALERFRNEVRTRIDIDRAPAFLIIPRVLRAGVVLGGEYGQGALRREGKTVDYYSLAGASLGLQVGVQEKNLLLVFMDAAALRKFREIEGWTAGVDAAVVIADSALEASFDTTHNLPVLAFIFGQRGLMLNATLNGAKFTRLKK
jgi:lipid-binding SYLF domain-containing protein